MLLLQPYVGLDYTRTLLDQRVTRTRLVLGHEKCRMQSCWMYDLCIHFMVSVSCVDVYRR